MPDTIVQGLFFGMNESAILTKILFVFKVLKTDFVFRHSFTKIYKIVYCEYKDKLYSIT